MNKKILVVLIVVIISSISIINVFAYEFCPNCNTNTMSVFCGNTVDHLYNAYHYVWDPTYEQYLMCEYTQMYYKNLYSCGICEYYYYENAHIHSHISHEKDPVMNGVVCTLNIY